ncbi:MAG: phosphoglucosamine mutase [Betaproteobacteria bacterium]|nr:phosphoglucosamine mutase [Betaproteobacteria bacterium]
MSHRRGTPWPFSGRSRLNRGGRVTKRKYFGTDGIRGRVGEPPITPELVMRLGFAAGVVLSKEAPPGTHAAVLIGKDTRISGYLLESALQAGLAAAGVDVWLAGPMPTPAIAYLTRALRLSAGVVISASHNPYDDNGIKFFGANGHKLPDEVERRIEERLEAPIECRPSAELGKARRVVEADGRYIEFCKSTFPNERDLRGLRVVVDSANGAGYHVAGPVLHELGAEVIEIGNHPDGLNINEGCGATHPGFIAEEVRRAGAHLGLALDGDGDRLIMVDGAGRIYDGDQLLYVIARHRKRAGTMSGGVVGTVMTNFGMEKALERLEIPFARSAVGDRYVLEMLMNKGWTLGGEGSGHIVCLDKHTTGDGLISGLQVLDALASSGETLAEACADVRLMPQRLINVPVRRGFDFRSNSDIVAAVQGAERRLDRRGRVLLRPSGTEPVLRVMVEGEDEKEVSLLAGQIADVIKALPAAA